MYLSNVKLWNFRKYGSGGEIDLENPNLNLNLTKGLNVLIGENDSGKTTIIDAIKLILRTHSYEWFKIEPDDFYENSSRFRIELQFEDLKDDEAKNFTEWLGWTGEGNDAKPYLRLIYDVKRNINTLQVVPSDIRAGTDSEGYIIDAAAREYLKTTYLKPLRDAQAELIPKKSSRLSQILMGHEAFKGRDRDHDLVALFRSFNLSVEKYFDGIDNNGESLEDQKGKALKDQIDSFIKAFYHKDKESQFSVSESKLRNILEKLELSVKDERSPGLGTLNRLFISSELLHLHKMDWNGIRLGLIEELEAHLHPQAQMQIIEALQNVTDIQLILTTHSPNLGSKIKLNNLIICNNNWAFPMGNAYTKLSASDYIFLERFLDTTKANLFFAKGVILVEGWAEEIFLPTLAKKIGYNLTEKGVSIVNIGNTAFLRYSNIFKRLEGKELDIPVAILTDLDVKPTEENVEENGVTKKALQIANKETKYNDQKVKAFISPQWTLEYCLFQSISLNVKFVEVVKEIHNGSDWTDFEAELTNKLTSKSLNKTEIAYRMAKEIEDDAISGVPFIYIDTNDLSIKYLVDAIKYACRD